MRNKITITEPFTEQYTLFIHSDIKAVNVHMISVSQMRWEFTVLNIEQDFIEVRLLLLDHILVEANNPIIKEIAELSKIFNRLYNELHLKINNTGKIIEIVNMSFILSKWEQTKKEMEEIAENISDIKNVILLNDNIFQDQNKLKDGIQNSEFFLMYFNKIYGKYIPCEFRDKAANFFNSTNIDWTFELNRSFNPKLSDEETILSFLGNPSINFFNISEFNIKAYSQFSNQIDIKKLRPKIEENGIFRIIKKSGRIVEASINREEIADKENLYSKMKYIFYSEEIYKYKSLNENITDVK